MVRVLSQLFENTVYSFAVILETYLFATAVGAGIYQRMHRRKEKKELLSTLLLCTATCTLVAVYSLRYADVLFSLVKQAYGQNFIGALGAEMTLALLYFFLPTAAMGATFSHLAQSLKGEKNGVGRALCLNTVGGAFAPLVFGMFLLPRVGLLIPLLLIPAVYTLAMLFARIRPLAFAGIMLCLLALMVDQDKGAYQFVRMEKGHRLLAYREGVMASVSVIQDRHDGVHLKVNNHFQMGGTTSIFSDRRQAYLPLLLHKDPQKALFLGVGSGATFAAAADFPNLQATGVELVPEVVEVLSHFAKVNKSIDLSKRLKVVSADARRYVTTTQERYDVIVADLFHPARDGAGGLYTQEHFRAIRDRLSDDGLFCQWLPFYQLDLSLFKVIATTFLDVFPDGKAFLAHYSIEQPMIGLIGGKAPLLYPENWYIKRMHSKRFQRLMAGFGYDSVYSLLGTFLAGSRQLGQFVQGSAINTDVNPVVSFQAPLFVYEKQQPARERLVQLLDAFSPPPPDAILSKVVTEEDYLARERFPAYWNARDSFLRLGMEVQRTDNVVQLYKTASEPLLRVVRQSTDFSAAYYPLVSIAYELYPYDRDGSYQLLRKLERANPLRPEAPLLRQKLFSRHKPGEKKMGLPF
jgi:spermidine synthase